MKLTHLDRYLPARIRTYIEQNYYAKVNEQADLDHAAFDEDFLKDPISHVVLYTDHGVVHVRDVACNILVVLDTINGVLIPKRKPRYLDFMKGYGVMLAYNHDIGMREFSAFGRAMHPEFATQEVFSPAYDEVVSTIWEQNCGNVSWRLINLVKDRALEADPQLILREMLAMAVGHSKSKVPIEDLNDPKRFRAVMMRSAAVDLHHLYHEQQVDKAKIKLDQAKKLEVAPQKIAKLSTLLAQKQAEQTAFRKQERDSRYAGIEKYYDDFENDAFKWLLSDDSEVAKLLDDVLDTIRALRVADALRQRGSVLKTSGSYQILVDQNTANAVYALEKGSGERFLLEINKSINAGEANIASSELTTEGDLRISCNRGLFSTQEATRRGAYNVAIVVDEIQQDILDTFKRPDMSEPAPKVTQDIRILIENADDNLEFAELVLDELAKIDSSLIARSRIVPSLKNIAPEERERYLLAQAPDWSPEETRKILLRIAQAGHKIQQVDLEKAFTDVRITQLKQGETLIHAGAPPGFIYIAMDRGLLSTPLGGYQVNTLKPWIPLGNTRVIRGDVQEATLTAERSVKVIIVPKGIYLKHWHDAYNSEELAKELVRVYNEDKLHGFEQIFKILREIALIDHDLDDTEVVFIQKFVESHGIYYSTDEIKQKLLAEGESDVTTLRRDTMDYIASEPPYIQVAQLRDLIHLLVHVDEQVSAEEALILSELNGLLSNYLDKDSTKTCYKVLIIPQSVIQYEGIEALLPRPTKIENAWGQAFLCGTYFSKNYADMIVQRYRNLNFYAIIEQED